MCINIGYSYKGGILMKKILMICLLLSFILILCACGNSQIKTPPEIEIIDNEEVEVPPEDEIEENTYEEVENTIDVIAEMLKYYIGDDYE